MRQWTGVDYLIIIFVHSYKDIFFFTYSSDVKIAVLLANLLLVPIPTSMVKGNLSPCFRAPPPPPVTPWHQTRCKSIYLTVCEIKIRSTISGPKQACAACTVNERRWVSWLRGESNVLGFDSSPLIYMQRAPSSCSCTEETAEPIFV